MSAASTHTVPGRAAAAFLPGQAEHAGAAVDLEGRLWATEQTPSQNLKDRCLMA